MIDLFNAYQPLFDLVLLHSGYAFSQYIVLRAGVFSLATAGFAAVGAYTAAVLAVRFGIDPLPALAAALLSGMLVALLLSWPLSRLRGVYQAIATLAFVQIVLSLNLYAEGVTGGAMGLNGIPKLVDSWGLLAVVAVVLYLMAAIGATRVGRAFDAVRQDEAVAATLGVSVVRHQALAFALSGAIGGLFGGLEAFHSFALEPRQFGFGLMVTIVAYVVLGGRRAVSGPLAGTAILVALPELARPLADNRLLAFGVMLMLVIAFLPRGVADTLQERLKHRRITRLDARLAGDTP